MSFFHQCSTGRPCERCRKLFDAAAGRRNLQWRECLSTNLEELNIHAIQRSAPNHSRIATTLQSVIDDTTLRGCFPLLACLAEGSKWWTPNMTSLFGSSLLPYFTLAPTLILKGGALFLAMETHTKMTEPVVRYISTEPVKLRKGYSRYCQNSNCSKLLLCLTAFFKAWCFRLALCAIQRTTGRSKVARMSRIDRIRLLVCLLSVLKVVTVGPKIAHTALWGFTPCHHSLFSSSHRFAEEEMQKHLVQIIAYHILQLIPLCLVSNTALNSCFVKSNKGLVIEHSMFTILSSEIEQFVKVESKQRNRLTTCGPVSYTHLTLPTILRV